MLIGIVGWKNSGKTTLIERLIPLLNQRGLKVATVKHTHHDLRPHDGATDGERHVRAGAIHTVVVAPNAWEVSGHRQESAAPAFADLARDLSGADLALIEGYKNAPIPKIEVRRHASPTQEPLAARDDLVVAVVSDHVTDAGGLPLFDLDDIDGIAGFIAARVA